MFGYKFKSAKDGQTYTVVGQETSTGDWMVDSKYFRFYVKSDNLNSF